MFLTKTIPPFWEDIAGMNLYLAIGLIVLALAPLLKLIKEPKKAKTLPIFAGISVILLGITFALYRNTGICVLAACLPMYIYDLTLFLHQDKKLMSTKTLVYGAICIAISFVLSFITFYKLPNGGSITPASMLPMIIFAYSFGTVPGLIAGVVYGVLQFIQAPYYLNLIQFLFDYILPFGLLGLAGLIRSKNLTFNLLSGTVIACIARYICHIVSGVAFFAEYAPAGMNPLWYSTVYNAFVLVEMAICMVILLVPPVQSFIKRLKITA